MFERKRIAEILRGARENRGLSLEQAASAAGIPPQYLRLLEGEENVRVGVSDELYLIPFFRKYASFVGIDAEELLPEFLGMVQQMSGEGSPPIRLAYRSRYASLWKPLTALLTIAIAATLLLRQARERPAFDDAALEETSPPVATVEATATTMASVTPEPTAALATAFAVQAIDATAVKPAASPALPSTAGHSLMIAASEDAWLALALDDQTAKQYFLRAGESRSWNADRFTLTVGNAGGVVVSVDGHQLPAIGPPGKVVRNLRLPQQASTASPTPG